MESSQSLLLILYYYFFQFNNIILAKFLALLLKSVSFSLSERKNLLQSFVLESNVQTLLEKHLISLRLNILFYFID